MSPIAAEDRSSRSSPLACRVSRIVCDRVSIRVPGLILSPTDVRTVSAVGAGRRLSDAVGRLMDVPADRLQPDRALLMDAAATPAPVDAARAGGCPQLAAPAIGALARHPRTPWQPIRVQ